MSVWSDAMAIQMQYHVDLVLVIDATASMTPVLSSVRNAALSFHQQLTEELTRAGKHVDMLRIRVVVFRDLKDDGDRGLAASEFFVLPQGSAAFAAWLNGITLIGGTTFPESGLAGLSVALNSSWTKGGHKRRHVVVLWTDDDAHLPETEYGYVPSAFRGQVADSFDELTDAWESTQFAAQSAKRLILFAPDKGVWRTIDESWSSVILHPSRAGEGVSDYDMAAILAAIANSV